MKTTDEQLISDYIEGDENSLSVLVDRYITDAYNFAFKLTHNRQAAEDVVQDSFIKAWKNIRRWKHGSNFKTWLFAITKNTAIDWLRRKKELNFSSFENNEGKNVFTENLADAGLLPDELIERAENVQFAQGLLNELDPLYRDVLTLRYSSNLTFKEIGQILKRPLHTVKSQHRRALVAIRRSIQAKIA